MTASEIAALLVGVGSVSPNKGSNGQVIFVDGLGDLSLGTKSNCTEATEIYDITVKEISQEMVITMIRAYYNIEKIPLDAGHLDNIVSNTELNVPSFTIGENSEVFYDVIKH